ncbi:MAG: pyruvate kinase [bacterium]|nr:MAG: pyruvate kinase [bacterium]
MGRKVKIVATLGPVTDNRESVCKLIEAGVNVFRLNFSYGTHESHYKSFQLIRKHAAELGKEVAVMQDICGPKIRIRGMKESREINKGDKIIMSKKAGGEAFSITYPYIIDQLVVGDEVYFADGTVKSKVVEKSGDKLVLQALSHGQLREGKGVNIPRSGIKMSALTEKDKADLKFAAEIGIDIVAVSFVETAEDVLEARKILTENHSDAWIIAKIERKSAMKNLDEILNVADGLMVARGDLGVEAGIFSVPGLQKKMIKKANKRALPVITATQMLTSMLHASSPTRAEISDIANAVYDGSDAVMLSDETAVGSFPVEAVEVMVKTLSDTQHHLSKIKKIKPDKTEGFAHAAAEISGNIPCKAIVPFTTSGCTVRQIAKFRPRKPLYAVTFDEKVSHRLALVWGVEKVFTIKRDISESHIFYQFLQKAGKEESYIVTMGSHVGVKGSTNMVRLLDEAARKKIFERFEK